MGKIVSVYAPINVDYSAPKQDTCLLLAPSRSKCCHLDVPLLMNWAFALQLGVLLSQRGIDLIKIVFFYTRSAMCLYIFVYADACMFRQHWWAVFAAHNLDCPFFITLWPIPWQHNDKATGYTHTCTKTLTKTAICISKIISTNTLKTWLNRRVGVWSLPWRWHNLFIPVTIGRCTGADLLVGWCVSSWWPLFPSRSFVVIYALLYESSYL